MIVAKGQAQIKVILTALGLVMFFAVISSSFRIINENSPEIANTCVRNAVTELITDKNEDILSEDAARLALENITGSNATFLHNVIDVCEVSVTGYVFEHAENTTYIVCGDGKIYRYKDLCNQNDRWKSLISVIETKKNIEISDKNRSAQ